MDFMGQSVITSEFPVLTGTGGGTGELRNVIDGNSLTSYDLSGDITLTFTFASPAWVVDVGYLVGNRVSHSSEYYECVEDHISKDTGDNANEPGVDTGWERYWIKVDATKVRGNVSFKRVYAKVQGVSVWNSKEIYGVEALGKFYKVGSRVGNGSGSTWTYYECVFDHVSRTETAPGYVILPWAADQDYVKGDRRSSGSKNYECISPHRSETGKPPGNTIGYWVERDYWRELGGDDFLYVFDEVAVSNQPSYPITFTQASGQTAKVYEIMLMPYLFSMGDEKRPMRFLVEKTAPGASAYRVEEGNLVTYEGHSSGKTRMLVGWDHLSYEDTLVIEQQLFLGLRPGATKASLRKPFVIYPQRDEVPGEIFLVRYQNNFQRTVSTETLVAGYTVNMLLEEI